MTIDANDVDTMETISNLHDAEHVAHYYDTIITRISYETEIEQLKEHDWPTLSHEEAHDLLEKVFANYTKTSTPELVLLDQWMMDAKVGLSVNGNSVAASYWRTGHTVYCRPECLTVNTILHEAAHALVQGHVASHGMAFRKKRDVLLRRHAKVNPKEMPSADKEMGRLELAYDKARRVSFGLRSVASVEQKGIDSPAHDEWKKKLLRELEALQLQMQQMQEEGARRSRARFEAWRQARQAQREKMRRENEVREKKRAEDRARWEKLQKERAEKDPEWARRNAERARRKAEACCELDRLVREAMLKNHRKRARRTARLQHEAADHSTNAEKRPKSSSSKVTSGSRRDVPYHKPKEIEGE